MSGHKLVTLFPINVSNTINELGYRKKDIIYFCGEIRKLFSPIPTLIQRCAQQRFISDLATLLAERDLFTICPKGPFYLGITHVQHEDPCQTGRMHKQSFFSHSSSITKTCLFKYTENFTTKKWKFSDKKFWYFSCFCSKHRLWVLIRTASLRQF